MHGAIMSLQPRRHVHQPLTNELEAFEGGLGAVVNDSK